MPGYPKIRLKIYATRPQQYMLKDQKFFSIKSPTGKALWVHKD